MAAPPPAQPPASTTTSLARPTGILMIACALVSLTTALFGTGFGNDVLPPAVRYANLGAAIVDLGLGAGIMRHKRAAWAFGMSIFGTLTLVNLLGSPWMIRGGVAGGIALGLAAARVVSGSMLLAAKQEFERT